MLELVIEHLLPVSASPDTVFAIDSQEQRSIALSLKPFPDFYRDILVHITVTYEYP